MNYVRDRLELAEYNYEDNGYNFFANVTNVYRNKIMKELKDFEDKVKNNEDFHEMMANLKFFEIKSKIYLNPVTLEEASKIGILFMDTEIPQYEVEQFVIEIIKKENANEPRYKIDKVYFDAINYLKLNAP